MNAYDVIVVGAGPAGAFAAYNLARAGARVALLEKERMPRRKPCGGGLSPKALQTLPFDLAPVIKSECSVAEFRYAKREYRIVAPHDRIGMVCRPEFDLFLAEHAAEVGADFRQQEPVMALEQADRVCVETPRGHYRAAALIAADGANGFVAKQAGLRPRDFAPYGLAIEAEIETADDPLGNRLILDFNYRGGYGWIFPKGNLYNVGVGAIWPSRFSSIRRDFDAFLEELHLPLAGPVRTEARKIPIGGWQGPLVAGRVIAAGDAGGLADPFLGEGIAYALSSARIAAEETLAFLAGKRPDLARYQRRIQRSLGLDLRLMRQLGRLFYARPGLCVLALGRILPLQKLFIAYVSGRLTLGRAY